MLIKKAHRHRGRKKAQSVVEYAIFIAAISAALIGLQIYFQRGVKGNYKQRADSVGEQFTTTQDYSIESQSQTLRSAKSGYLDGGARWSNSEILTKAGTMDATDEIADDWINDLPTKLSYQGYEFSKTDYVTPDANTISPGVGTHATFDSGEIGDITPWQDATTGE